MSTERPYHHGDLKRVIIETAGSMLREEKGWQFTLREVARRAGVSHAAPYKHFSDKNALLAELTMQGFEQLRGTLINAITPEPTSARAAFLTASAAYVQFGMDNPSLYRLMFASGDASANVHLSERVLGALSVPLEILKQGQEAGEFKERDLQMQAAACWAQVHGITMLSIDGLLMPEKVGNNPIQSALEVLLEGLVV